MDEENSFVALEGPQICLSLPPIDFALLLRAMPLTQEFTVQRDVSTT